RISQSHEYRLPTDLEWSRLVGLSNEDPNVSPGTRDSRKREVFPWGPSLEEANIPGNFADMTAALHPDTDVDRTIRGYDDGYAFTAPVGSYEPNELGIHDLSGNIQEWVSDPFSKHAENSLGVLRGGGWNTYQLENLYSGSRNAAPVDYAGPMYGFRVVLARKQPELRDPVPEEP
ncbi:MAG: SUMF1/EgtB/PvdO family nonheme iron enzyme, partial [Akkermansiaceae bacterium]|nr:SUMF1/EgtB/PvdO family nonheme iron enzyme [Akkermansiaceae bacterium]